MPTANGTLRKQIESALAVCRDSKCGVSQHARDPLLIDQVRGSDAAINNNYKVQLNKATMQDAEGRIAHVRALTIEGMLKLVATGASTAVTRRSLFGVIAAMSLKNLAGHTYFNNIDGRVLIDEMFVRFGRHTQGPYNYLGIGEQGSPFPQDIFEDADVGATIASPLTTSADAADLATVITLANELKGDLNGIIGRLNEFRNAFTGPHSREFILAANAPAGNYYVHFRFEMKFVAPPQFGLSQMEGLIPLPYLAGNQDSLQLRVNSVIPNVTGVTIGEILTADRRGQPNMVSAVNTAPPNATTGYDIWADVEYLPAVVLDRNWLIESVSLPTVQGIHDKQGMVTQHLGIRYLDEETPNNADNHDMFAVQVGSFPIMKSLTKEQALERTLSHFAQNMWSGMSMNNAALDLPFTEVGGGVRKALFVSVIPHRGYEYAAKGPIHFQFQRTTATHTRWLRRTVDCHQPSQAEEIARMIASDCGCGSNGTLFGTTADGSVCAKLNPNQPLIFVPKKLSRGL